MVAPPHSLHSRRLRPCSHVPCLLSFFSSSAKKSSTTESCCCQRGRLRSLVLRVGAVTGSITAASPTPDGGELGAGRSGDGPLAGVGAACAAMAVAASGEGEGRGSGLVSSMLSMCGAEV